MDYEHKGNNSGFERILIPRQEIDTFDDVERVKLAIGALNLALDALDSVRVSANEDVERIREEIEHFINLPF